MKLPFKLPAFKLPSFGKKKAVEDDDDGDENWDDIDLDEPEVSNIAEESTDTEAAAPLEEEQETSAAASGEVVVPDEEGDSSALSELESTLVDDSGEEDDEDEEKKAARGSLLSDKKRLTILIAATVVGVLLLAGLGWYLFSGDEDGAQNAREDTGVPRFEMDIAPKERAAEAGSLNAISATEKGPGAGIVASASMVMAFAKIAPPQVTDGPLPAVQGLDLVEQSHQGPLPKIADDGRMPMQVYAKSFDAKDDRPKIALIVTGLGLSQAATDAAIALLPGAITLAFDPYAPDLQGWADKARKAGHEILIMVPMEPESFPVNDPGPQGLMTINSEVENLLRLEFILSRMQGYVGVVTAMGSKFNKDETQLAAFLKNVKERGLLFVDGSADQKSLAPALAEKIQLPKAFADMVLDTTPTKEAVDAKLADLESDVRINAVGVALIEAYPISIERVAAWAASLAERNVTLAPVSAVVDRQFLQ